MPLITDVRAAARTEDIRRAWQADPEFRAVWRAYVAANRMARVTYYAEQGAPPVPQARRHWRDAQRTRERRAA